MAEPISIQQLKDASEDAISLAEFINKPENVMIPRRLASDIHSLQYYLEYMKSFAQRSYETYDEMVANASNLSENVSVFVTNDSDTSKNGIYTYNGESFVKGEYQPENAAKEFVEDKLGGLEVFDGKVRAQDVSTVDGSTQDVKNIEFRNELDELPFEDGALADTFVTVTPSVTGMVVQDLREVLGEVVSVKRFGAKGDGVTDDTLAIQAAFNHGGNILIPRGDYLVSSQGAATVNRFTFALKVLSNSNITFEKGAKIKLKANAEERCLLMFLDRQTDIVIDNLHIIGDRDTHLGTTGEHGHGVGIFGGANVRFNNPTIEKSWGDGVYICSNYTADPDKKVPKNVSFIGGTIKDNSRNGIALAGLDGGLFVDIDYIDNDRIAPKAAFDVEPFTSSDKTNSSGVVKNIFVRDSRATGGDVGFMGLFNNTDIPKNSLTFLNLDVENVAKAAYVFGTSNTDDTITARDLRANNVGYNGLSIPHVNSIGSIFIDNINLKNCNQVTSETAELNSAIILYNKNTRPYVLGNVDILNISVDSPLSTHALMSSEQSASVTTYGNTENVRFSFKKAKSSLAPISLFKIKSKVQDNTDGDLTNKAEASSLTVNTSAGMYTSYISSSTQRTTFKLPPVKYIFGLEITFKVGAGGSLLLQPNTSNSILHKGELVTLYLQSNQIGAWVKVAARDDGQWEVVGTYGDWYSPKTIVATTGSTEQRPTNATNGHQYFDTTINKPIYWTGSSWVDAAGQEV